MTLRTFLLGLSAFCIAAAAAYFSVTGLSKLFAGASTAVILMASSLEFGKLISASFLYVYWNDINKVLRTYLLIGVVVLIFITSAGIYGFLTSAYQTTADQLGVITKQTEVIELKKKRFQEQLDGYTKEKSELNQSISTLSKGLSNNVIQYKDKDGNLITTTSSANRKTFEAQLNDAKKQRDVVNLKIETLSDSITKLDLKIIDVSVNNDLAAEVGPLKYMAEVTGKPMSTIVNWFALLIIFVFDPLAVTLVIAFNTALKFDKGKQEPKKEKEEEKVYKVYGDKTLNEEKIKSSVIEMSKKDAQVVAEVLENPPPPSDTLIKAVQEYKELVKDPELESLQRSYERRPIDTDGDGNIDGYDTNGDGLIDEYQPASSIRWRYAENEKPYYARTGFDWNNKAAWINDQNAVNYWITHRKI